MQISQQKPYTGYQAFILLFVALKLLLNLLAGGHYGYHRDELLYLTLGDHLDWGYKEVPPFIALLAKIATATFGSSVWSARIFTAMTSALIVWFTGLLTVQFGGGRFAIALACLCIIFSPGMAASGYLFQPVVFDQLWWLIAAWLTVKYVNTQKTTCLYWMGIITGAGLLNKYTMAFFVISLVLGLLLTPQRKLLWRKETGMAFLLAILLFLPNIIWQYAHHWPVVTHMHSLKTYQLDYIRPSDFILQQLLLHGACVFVWLAGLCFLLFHKVMRPYRFVAFAYLLVFAFLLKMNGKAYYLLAGYPMLFAAGGYGLAYLIKNSAVRAIATVLFIAPNVLLLPIVLPVLTINQALSFFRFCREHLPYMDFAVTWEDQKKHATTQDYADMFGWEEIAQKVADTYHSLPPEQQKHTVIFADNYGEAGALHIYRKKHHLPEPVCLNSSFALWAPDNLNARHIIYVSDDNDVSDFRPLAAGYIRVGMIEHKLARERGTGIFLIVNIKPEVEAVYQKHLEETRKE